MSYAKAMKHSIRASRKQANGIMFSTLGKNERRLFPRLGAAWYEEGKDKKRAEFIAEWHRETVALLASGACILADTGGRTSEQINKILGV
jgi:hypothetical protein